MARFAPLLPVSLLAFALPAQAWPVVPYGEASGATSGASPSAWIDGAPNLPNAAFALTVSAVAPNRPCAALLSLSPADLPVLGVRALVDPGSGFLGALPALTSAVGGARVALPLPPQPALEGARVFAQWIVAAPAGLDASDGVAITLRREPMVIGVARTVLETVSMTDGSVVQEALPTHVDYDQTRVALTRAGDLAVLVGVPLVLQVRSTATRPMPLLLDGVLPSVPLDLAVHPSGELAYVVYAEHGVPRIGAFDIVPGSTTFGQEVGRVSGLPAEMPMARLAIAGDGRVMVVATREVTYPTIPSPGTVGHGPNTRTVGDDGVLVVDVDPSSASRNAVIRSIYPGSLRARLLEVAVTADGAFAYARSGFVSANVEVFDLVRGRWVQSLNLGTLLSHDLVLDPRERFVVVTRSDVGRVDVVDLLPDRTLGAVRELAFPGVGSQIALTADGARIVAFANGRAEARDVATGALVWSSAPSALGTEWFAPLEVR